MIARLKVYELAKELNVDPQHMVDTVQRLGIDVKNTMSALGTEEVRTIKEHYRKNKVFSKKSPGTATSAPTTSSVTEKRVGSKVIRRRVAPKTEEQQAAPVVEEAPVSVTESVGAPSESENIESQESVEVSQAGEETPVETHSAASEGEQASKEVAPAAPEAVAPTRSRRTYTSIIKKVGTEQYLGEKIGPKMEGQARPKKVEAPKRPGTQATSATTEKKEGESTAAPHRRVVREVDTVTEAAKEAGRKKVLEKQNVTFRSADYLKREMVHAMKKKKTAARPALKTLITTPAEHKRVVEMAEKITVSEFAKQVGVKAAQVITKLMNLGVMVTMNDSIDFDTASLIAPEFQHEVKQKVFKEEDYVPQVSLDAAVMEPRGPVVTIMGHVDHGKTSLLDSIRKTQVAAGEAGGITQHIGAYTVELKKGKIAFLDTPGHEAFTAMRARGAKVTDIVILVVSAVDGVQPQTLESVAHAKAANVPIIVAVNKTDLPDANPDRVKQNLAGHDLNPEEWGGDTIYVNVSAKTGKGIDQLLEAVLLQAEILELKANFKCPMKGTVVESKLDKNRGPVATILVQHGILKNGDLVVAGTSFGKVRAMTNSYGKRMDSAGPSDPVEVLGLPNVPNVGDDIFAVEDEKRARELTEARVTKQKAQVTESRPKMTLEELLAQSSPGTEKELRLVLKGDVQGSVEALKEALSKLPQDKCKIKILHSGTGGITESDVMLSHASQAVILGFNIRPDIKAQRLAEVEGVEIRTYNIIYELLEETKTLLAGKLDKIVKEKVIGRAEVRNVFSIPKIGTIAGSAVIDGKVTRGCFLRLLRDNRVIYEGKISSLRRFKDDVKEVQSGFECGIGVENFNDLKLGDQLEAFVKEESVQSL